MTDHTPGPWSVGNSRKQPVDSRMGPMWEATVHVGEGANLGNCLASVGLGGPGALHSTREAVEANAKLIASAPDLLDACMAAKDLLIGDLEEPGRTVFWKLIAALKKTGWTA